MSRYERALIRNLKRTVKQMHEYGNLLHDVVVYHQHNSCLYFPVRDVIQILGQTKASFNPKITLKHPERVSIHMRELFSEFGAADFAYDEAYKQAYTITRIGRYNDERIESLVCSQHRHLKETMQGFAAKIFMYNDGVGKNSPLFESDSDLKNHIYDLAEPILYGEPSQHYTVTVHVNSHVKISMEI